MSREVVAALLRTAFGALGVQQNEFAVQIGVDPATINRWFKGGALPGPNMVPVLAERLGIPLDTLRVEIAKAQEEEKRKVRRENASLKEMVLDVSRDSARLAERIDRFFDRYEEMGHSYASLDSRVEQVLADLAEQKATLATSAKLFDKRVGKLERLLGELLAQSEGDPPEEEPKRPPRRRPASP